MKAAGAADPQRHPILTSAHQPAETPVAGTAANLHVCASKHTGSEGARAGERERERGRKRQGASASMVKITELDGDESVGIGLAVHT